MKGQNSYGDRTDEQVYHAFTKYVQLAIEGGKKNYIAKKYRSQMLSLDELLEKDDSLLAAEDPEFELVLDHMESLEQVICNDALLVAILRLSDRERRIMNLRLLHKMKHREIADLLGITSNTVEQSYARSIKKLREYMKEGRDEKF